MDKSVQKELEIIHSVFEKNGVRLFLLYGALLGLYRDKDLIPYDDDIDFGIIDDISYEQRIKLWRGLRDLGFKNQEIAFDIYGEWVNANGYNGNEYTGIIVCEKNFKYTFFFYQLEDCNKHGKEYVCTPMQGSRKLISIPSLYFEKNDIMKIGSKKFLTPYPIKDYLDFTYGNWKIPEKGKHAQQYREAHQ
jgi:phosphorylcholine metabolism protein LicD